MTDGLRPIQGIEVGLQPLPRDIGGECHQIVPQRLDAMSGLLDDRVQLDPIARREDDPLVDPGPPLQPRQRFRQTTVGDGKPLPEFDRRRSMVQSDRNDIHGYAKGCCPFSITPTSVKTTPANPTTVKY